MNETDATEYFSKYNTDTIYIQPTKENKGYITLVSLDISKKVRLVIQVFYVGDKKDFSTFKIIKLKQTKKQWIQEQEVTLSQFQLLKIREFLNILNGMKIETLQKDKLSLIKDIDEKSLSEILRTEKGRKAFKALSEDNNLCEDIFALAYKKSELEKFRKLLFEFEAYRDDYVTDQNLFKKGEENIWQHFFEKNPWIFGHGLNYVFLEKEGKKLESVTTGHTHSAAGKRVDALMRTKAMISQYVLIEIKKPSSKLLQTNPYRSGCWSVSQEVLQAVSQIQKTVFDFARNEYCVALKDEQGDRTGEEIYKITPKSYLIIGDQSEIINNDDQIICFTLFRNSLANPEIITFDELFERAKCIIETLNNICM